MIGFLGRVLDLVMGICVILYSVLVLVFYFFESLFLWCEGLLDRHFSWLFSGIDEMDAEVIEDVEREGEID